MYGGGSSAPVVGQRQQLAPTAFTMRPAGGLGGEMSPAKDGAGGSHSRNSRGGGGGFGLPFQEVEASREEDIYMSSGRSGSDSSAGSAGSITGRVCRSVPGSSQSMGSASAGDGGGALIGQKDAKTVINNNISGSNNNNKRHEQSNAIGGDTTRSSSAHHERLDGTQLDNGGYFFRNDYSGDSSALDKLLGSGRNETDVRPGSAGGGTSFPYARHSPAPSSTSNVATEAAAASAATATRRPVSSPLTGAKTQKSRAPAGGEKVHPIDGLGPAREPRRPQPLAGQGVKSRRGGEDGGRVGGSGGGVRGGEGLARAGTKNVDPLEEAKAKEIEDALLKQISVSHGARHFFVWTW